MNDINTEGNHELRSAFAEWYGPREEEIEEFLAEATIALDANVLLALYRVGGPQRSDLMRVLRKVSDRLLVPYQSALEYQRNRLTVAWSQQKIYDTIEKLGTEKFTEAIETTEALLRDLRKQAIESLRDKEISSVIASGFDTTIARIQAVANERREQMHGEFAKLRETHAIDFATIRVNDPIRAELDTIITDDRIGTKPNAETEASRREQASERGRSAIPPGYIDFQKSGGVGDCLIWFELLEYAKSRQRPILFITDDRKEDWYERLHGETVGPRVELRAEMLEIASQQYHQTTVDQFLRLAKKYLQVDVSDETINQYRSSRAGGTRPAATIDKDAASKQAARKSDGVGLDVYDTGSFRVADILEQELAELQAERRRARNRYVKKKADDRAALRSDFNQRRAIASKLIEECKYTEALAFLYQLASDESSHLSRTDSVETRFEIAAVHLHLNEFEQALSVAQGLFDLLRNEYGSAHQSTRDALRLMEDITNVMADSDNQTES